MEPTTTATRTTGTVATQPTPTAQTPARETILDASAPNVAPTIDPAAAAEALSQVAQAQHATAAGQML